MFRSPILDVQAVAAAEYERKGGIHMFELTDTYKCQLAKSLTELAIQNGLICQHENSVRTAEEVTHFFDTIVNTVGKSENMD
jgi:hypothetical protein